MPDPTHDPFPSVCRSDLSTANITSPNAFLGHTRRGKKCHRIHEQHGIALLGLKRYSPPKGRPGPHIATNSERKSRAWESVRVLKELDPIEYPDRDVWLSKVYAVVSLIRLNLRQRTH